jgi:hypothetical protein
MAAYGLEMPNEGQTDRRARLSPNGRYTLEARSPHNETINHRGLAFPTLNVERIIGSEKMRESRMLRRIKAETRRADILRVLSTRFREEPPADLSSALDAVEDVGRLETLLDVAVMCPDVDDFRAALAAGQTALMNDNYTSRPTTTRSPDPL